MQTGIDDRAHGARDTRARTIELVHKEQVRIDAVALRLAPHILALRFNALNTIKHDDRAVHDTHGTLDFNPKVNVTRRVHQRHGHIAPPYRTDRRTLDRDATLTLLLQKVCHSAPTVDIAWRHIRRRRVRRRLEAALRQRQDTLRQRRFPRIDMRNNTQRPHRFRGYTHSPRRVQAAATHPRHRPRTDNAATDHYLRGGGEADRRRGRASLDRSGRDRCRAAARRFRHTCCSRDTLCEKSTQMRRSSMSTFCILV